jgi:23S rRNA (uracil1939-C5)-methyltransferase
MTKKTSIKFEIEHIDPLGQGVFKDEEDIYFISGTLPGEKGTASVDRFKKNIHFGHLESENELNDKSKKRVTPECPHFFSCNGCHFLHTGYEDELDFKEKSLERMLEQYNKNTKGGPTTEIHVHSSSKRLGYRNRVQLHYDLHTKYIGFIGHDKRKIIPVPECRILLPVLEEKLKEIYKNNSWINLIPKSAPKKGHVELIINSQGEVNLIFNGPYAHGGFTQVHRQMNTHLQKIVFEIFKYTEHQQVMDLFGGSGNLSKRLSPTPCVVIDNHQEGLLVEWDGHQRFVKSNLYSNNAPQFVKKHYKENTFVILDPPRSGLKNLKDFLPENSKDISGFVYVSCNPQTFFRDIKTIRNDYVLKEIHLLDLFPGTYHFEVLGVLKPTE